MSCIEELKSKNGQMHTELKWHIKAIKYFISVLFIYFEKHKVPFKGYIQTLAIKTTMIET